MEEELAPLLTGMVDQIDRLTRLVNELLDASKIQAGRLDSAEEPVDFPVLVRATIAFLQASSPTHTLTVKGIPHAWITGDKDRLGQVVTNLITNAIKYSPQANHVDLSITTSERMVTLHVQDQGIGISKFQQKHIFERFYRAHDPADKRFPGLGMGLYISRAIVKQHGGEMSVESEEGKGSTFIVSLPLKT
jgi:signal transduction histidine kinase